MLHDLPNGHFSDSEPSHPRSDESAARVNATTQVVLPSHATAAAGAAAATTATAAAAVNPAQNVWSTTGNPYNPVTEVLNNASLWWSIAEFLPEPAPPPPQNLVRRSSRLAHHRGPVLYYQLSRHRGNTFCIPIYNNSPPPPPDYYFVTHGGDMFSVPFLFLTRQQRR